MKRDNKKNHVELVSIAAVTIFFIALFIKSNKNTETIAPVSIAAHNSNDGKGYSSSNLKTSISATIISSLQDQKIESKNNIIGNKAAEVISYEAASKENFVNDSTATVDIGDVIETSVNVVDSSAGGVGGGISGGSTEGFGGGGGSIADSGEAAPTSPDDNPTQTRDPTSSDTETVTDQTQDNGNTDNQQTQQTTPDTLIAGIDVLNTTDPNDRPYSATFLKPRELMAEDRWASRPLSPQKVIENVGRYGAIWCAPQIAKYNPAAWPVLGQSSSKPLLLYYLSGNSVNASSYTSLDYDYINKNHPEWFLLADATKPVDHADYSNPNKRMRWSDDPSNAFYYRYFVDVGNPEFQRWASSCLLERLNNGIYYDGIGLDNVLLTVWHSYITKRYPLWKYASSAALWNSAYFSFLQTLHTALNNNNYLLVVNHTTDYSSKRDGNDWDTLMNITDGLVDEAALMNWTEAKQELFSGEYWDFSIKHHEDILNQNLIDWWVVYPTEDPTIGKEQFKYIYCSFLLTKKPGKSFFYSTKEETDTTNLEVPWYQEYDISLGKAVSERFLQNNCWLREYENCVIAVNPTTSAQNLDMKSSGSFYTDTDSAGDIRSNKFILTAKTGKILLKAPLAE